MIPAAAARRDRLPSSRSAARGSNARRRDDLQVPRGGEGIPGQDGQTLAVPVEGRVAGAVGKGQDAHHRHGHRARRPRDAGLPRSGPTRGAEAPADESQQHRRRQARGGERPPVPAPGGGGHGPRTGAGVQVRQEVVDAPIAAVGVLGQGLPHRPDQGAGKVGAALVERLGLRVEDGLDLRRRGPLPEGAAAGDHLVEQDPQRPDVGAGVHRTAGGLLGGHVGRRPEGAAGAGQTGLVHALGDAEVEDLGLAVRGHHDVAGLDVAMDDAGLVGAGKAAAHLEGEVHRLVHRQRAAGEAGPQGLALVVGHHQVEPSVLGLADVVEGADVGVIEGRDQPRLAQEALAGFGAAAPAGGEELQRDGALEALVAGQIDDSHASRAEAAQDPVGAEDALLPARGALKGQGLVLFQEQAGGLFRGRSQESR